MKRCEFEYKGPNWCRKKAVIRVAIWSLCQYHADEVNGYREDETGESFVDPDTGVIDQFYIVRDNKARHSDPLWFVICSTDGRVFTVANQ